MPLVNDLRTQIADESGLHATNDTTVIIAALNRALRRVVSETECYKATVSIAGDASTVDVSLATATGLLTIDSAHIVSNAVYTDLTHASPAQVYRARTQAAAHIYAYEGGSLLLDGPVGVGNSTFLRYTRGATVLAAGGAEATITAQGIPAEFHEDLLAGLALTHLLEGYEGEEQRAAYYRALSIEALTRFKDYLRKRAGDEAMNDRAGATHFETPTPLGLR